VLWDWHLGLGMGVGYSGSFYIAMVADWEVSEGESEGVRE